MAHLNPFTDEDIEDSVVAVVRHEANTKEKSPDLSTDSDSVTLDALANKLIKENYILTALELHTELQENGRELTRLRDYFSNPVNFERVKATPDPAGSPGLPRTSSIQTFDSLDFARFSEDGDKESDKVAVLEFELRKAQDTIKSLRASLTRSAETDIHAAIAPLEEEDLEGFVEDTSPLRPYEKRAINYLLNEYLLQQSYKLTSVTFAEENDCQDVDTWDDVGLNVPKPPDLLHLFRDYGQHAAPCVDSKDVGVEADIPLVMEVESRTEELEELKRQLEMRIVSLEEQIETLRTENDLLVHQLERRESDTEKEAESEEERDLDQVKQAHSSTPAISPISTPAKTVRPSSEQAAAAIVKQAADRRDHGNDDDTSHTETEPAAAPAHERLEPLGGENKDGEGHLDVCFDPAMIDTSGVAGRLATWQPCRRKLCASFQKALLNKAFHVASDNRIAGEVAKVEDASLASVVDMLARCLPHIVPNVLLAKREELIPLILCTASLHADGKERDQLLNILFNLIKKPDLEQRQMILTGCVTFAQHVGPTRLEAELLPQCWEQISHKYAERRLLVAEACGALAPFLQAEMRGSLVLSMLQQMLQEERTEEVREAIVRTIGVLFGFIDDNEKYIQGSELLHISLLDPSPRVSAAARDVFLPCLALWAWELDRLFSHLAPSFARKASALIEGAVKTVGSGSGSASAIDRGQWCLWVSVLQRLVPVMYACVIEGGPFAHDTTTTPMAYINTRRRNDLGDLFDLGVMLGSHERVAALTSLYESYVAREWFAPWVEQQTLLESVIDPWLQLATSLDVSVPELVHALVLLCGDFCRMFGPTFTEKLIVPKFEVLLHLKSLDSSGDAEPSRLTPLTRAVVPVYLAGVLTHLPNSDVTQLRAVLEQLLVTMALQRLPLESVGAAITELCSDSRHHDLVLTVLWNAVVHASHLVRRAAAAMFDVTVSHLEDSIVSTRVMPALVTLANDPEMPVKVATVAAFGTIMECVTQADVLDKTHMQLQTFQDDPMYSDAHSLQVALIRTFARVAPNAEPRLRDEFVLPRLAAMAANNNQQVDEQRKTETALQLFDAYSALACCFISNQLLQTAMLPGLRSLQKDLAQVAPHHVDIVLSMIKEYEDKIDLTRPIDSAVASVADDVRSKMFNRIRDARDKTNISKLFGAKKS